MSKHVRPTDLTDIRLRPSHGQATKVTRQTHTYRQSATAHMLLGQPLQRPPVIIAELAQQAAECGHRVETPPFMVTGVHSESQNSVSEAKASHLPPRDLHQPSAAEQFLS